MLRKYQLLSSIICYAMIITFDIFIKVTEESVVWVSIILPMSESFCTLCIYDCHFRDNIITITSRAYYEIHFSVLSHLDWLNID